MKATPITAEVIRVENATSYPVHQDTLRTTALHTLGEFSIDSVNVGDVLGKYVLVARIGHGSTSFVFLGRHRKLQFPVAVKVLEPSTLIGAPHLIEALEAEAIHLAQINHPNVIRLWDLDDEGPVPYMVLEHVSGGTLADLIQRKGALPPAHAWAIIRQAAEGLAEAHKHGIIHRDVKPGNLLLGRDGHVKVADLGLAMVKSEKQKKKAAEKGRESLPTGTAGYIAPEQAMNQQMCDFRSDIYSLGCTLYQALTGRMPFEGRSSMEVIMKHLEQAPPDPKQLAPELTDECAAVVLKMLAKKPEDRYASYDDLRLALAQAIGDRRAPRPLAEAFLQFAGMGKA